jgi:hypothetical protein
MQQILFRLSALVMGLALAAAAFAQCPATLPIQGAPIRGTAPLFPATNWWNLDVSGAPTDPSSASYISFINNGGTRKLHPDFGGEVSPGSVGIYGFPYAVVDGNATTKQAVTFDYSDESDGVNHSTNQSVPFYPIPSQAITQSHWVEGGAAGNVDQRSTADRHLLIVDCVNNYLYELYNVWYSTSQAKWLAGSGAFFDMNADNRRPDGWTSADAAGLAILPGLVRYDEAYNAAVTDIGHAFRVTVRATNGYVYPASHRAGSTTGALPMGARLRLKTSVNSADPALRTSDPNIRKIFRAMQKYGLLVADNGSDMYISGTFDTRWNNDVLNPAFSLLSASDFEVIQLGWNPDTPPPPPPPPALSAISANPSSLTGGASSTGTVTLTAGAPMGGAPVTVTSNIAEATVPSPVTVLQGATSASFAIGTSAVTAQTIGTLTATYNGGSATTTITVNPPPPAALASLTISPTSVAGGSSATGTVQLTAAPSSNATVALSSSNTGAATVPPNVTVGAGSTSATFTITTLPQRKNASVTVLATYAGVTKTAPLSVKRR